MPMGSQRIKGEGADTKVGADRTKLPTALARVWLSKFSLYSQDPKKFAAMLLLSPWVVLGHSRSCGPSGGACQASIPLQGVCVSQGSFCRSFSETPLPHTSFSVPHAPTVSLCPPARPTAWLWVSLLQNGCRAHPLGWALVHSRESDIWEFRNFWSELRCTPGWTPAEEHPWHPLRDPLWPPNFTQD